MSYLQTRHEILGYNLARVCNWEGKDITKVYLQALTDADFHELRAKIAKLVNKELGTKLRLTG